jgi:hypothetical protein
MEAMAAADMEVMEVAAMAVATDQVIAHAHATEAAMVVMEVTDQVTEVMEGTRTQVATQVDIPAPAIHHTVGGTEWAVVATEEEVMVQDMVPAMEVDTEAVTEVEVMEDPATDTNQVTEVDMDHHTDLATDHPVMEVMVALTETATTATHHQVIPAILHQATAPQVIPVILHQAILQVTPAIHHQATLTLLHRTLAIQLLLTARLIVLIRHLHTVVISVSHKRLKNFVNLFFVTNVSTT